MYLIITIASLIVGRCQGLGVGYFLENIFPSGNFPRAFSHNVQFPNRKLPKSVLASACGPLACSSRSTRSPHQTIHFSLKLQDPCRCTPYCICIQSYRPIRLPGVGSTQYVLCNKCSLARSQCTALQPAEPQKALLNISELPSRELIVHFGS